MRLCRVLGPVVSTAKHPVYQGRKLLAVQPLDEHGQASGASMVAIDDVQAGRGDVVLVLQEGNGVRQLLRLGEQVPVRSLIVGIVDRVEVGG
ncbi:MAG: EutN/CcmL family microcompartment protein [Myxococcales bacterium]|nr:EutN/CcmL family microcompartment protein [Myxococcota bacterium]MDW8283167.1 EutN/CcmL family microcompartment protein [Myxococcales bacterium]